MQKECLYCGEDKIEFYVCRKKVKNVNLKITLAAEVIVSASDAVSLDYIKGFVKSKSAWVIKKIRYFNELKIAVRERKYESGEYFNYLGKPYRLEISKNENISVRVEDGYIFLAAFDINNVKLKKSILDNWYKAQAAVKFREIFEKAFLMVQKYQFKKPELAIKTLKTKWGSYSYRKNEITLNAALIKAPESCIEYVVLHELTHLKYKNHDKNFYFFLSSLVPDWKKKKEILNREIIKEICNL